MLEEKEKSKTKKKKYIAIAVLVFLVFMAVFFFILNITSDRYSKDYSDKSTYVEMGNLNMTGSLDVEEEIEEEEDDNGWLFGIPLWSIIAGVILWSIFEGIIDRD